MYDMSVLDVQPHHRHSPLRETTSACWALATCTLCKTPGFLVVDTIDTPGPIADWDAVYIVFGRDKFRLDQGKRYRI